ncbi:DUF4870 family protein [Ramlibacter albus]|uniref:DUF4870 domain-containing protein n=1 Tax=Ramlibacter albus TaxID=2079448 RepID=A0A923M8Q3_9BURK|nr:hypothetical protein [Ramlibacter albus]MBC5764804.1 hypothetical protein [Ramlibacter albus]
MPETDYAQFEMKSPQDRSVMNVLYGLHAVAPFTMWSLSVVALVVNYIKRGDEHDALYVMHHNYMISTFWWTILWLVLTSPLFLAFLIPGFVAWSIIGVWYVYRFVRGWLRFSNHVPPT